jgi:ABC-type transport system involved in multi-copper enzyme maturation permease subunit
MAQSQSAHTSGRSATGKTTVQKAATLVGIVFLAVGVLGFVPGITTNYGSMQFASHDSAAKLLGLFQVSILHNIVHLLFGIAGLALARTIRGAKNYLIVGGVVYLVLFIYGLAVPMDSSANFVPVNGADNVLHLLLGVGMIALGALLTRRPDVAPATNVAQS